MQPCSPPLDDAPTATTATHQYCSFHGDTGAEVLRHSKGRCGIPLSSRWHCGGPGGWGQGKCIRCTTLLSACNSCSTSPILKLSYFSVTSGWAQGGGNPGALGVALMPCQILTVAHFSQKQSETLSVVTQVFESVLQWREAWVDSSAHPERSPDSFPGSTCGRDPLPALETTQLPLSEESEKWNNYQVK